MANKNLNLITTPIRRIHVGPDLTRMYAVGNQGICCIEHDKQFLTEFGINRYVIYRQGKEDMYIWKVIEDMPVMVEADTKDE